jgi:hypothetical protein
MNNEREQYTLIEEPRGARYVQLLRTGLGSCVLATLVERQECKVAPSGKAIIDALKPFLKDERKVSEWPGTTLFGHQATLREYELTESCVDYLSSAVEGLFDWVQPGALEDLVLYRRDGTPWLVTIAHERDGYFVLSLSEFESLPMDLRGLVSPTPDSASP